MREEAANHEGEEGNSPSQFDQPFGVAVSGDGQTVWVTDSAIARISLWTRQPNGAWNHQINFGAFGSGPAQFNSPEGVAVSGDGQTAWIADEANERISVWTRQPNGAWSNQTTFGGEGDGPGQFRGPFGVAIAGDEQTVWVADLGIGRMAI